LHAGEPGAVFVWKMFLTVTLLTEPLASLKKIPNNPGNPLTGGPDVRQLFWGRTKLNPAAGPVTVRFSMFIVWAPAALVTIAPA
jgi:hypothetical protein